MTKLISKEETHRIHFDIRNQERRTLATYAVVSKPLLNPGEVEEELKGLKDMGESCQPVSLTQPAIGLYDAKALAKVQEGWKKRVYSRLPEDF
jgi:hypothetical protein